MEEIKVSTWMEALLAQDCKIIIWDSEKEIDILKRFMLYISSYSGKNNLVIIRKKNVLYDRRCQNEKSNYIEIEESQFEELLNLYNLYEFSDRIIMISESSQYPGLFNYLSTGLLTEEEFFEALLH